MVLVEVRKKFQVGPGDLLELPMMGCRSIYTKKLSLRDITGIGDGKPTDAVKLKKTGPERR